MYFAMYCLVSCCHLDRYFDSNDLELFFCIAFEAILPMIADITAAVKPEIDVIIIPVAIIYVSHCFLTVTGRHNDPTDGRHNGATKRCRNRALEQGQDWAIFGPFATAFLGASGKGLGAR